ncbi:triose-phosphate isomerase [Photobacterium sp. DNB23_23_1]
MKKVWIGTSWKMNGNAAHTAAYLETLLAKVEQYTDTIQPFIIPPFPYLQQASQQVQGSAVKLGSQNVAHLPSGAFTGEVAAPMLKEFGVSVVEMGHSERRSLFGETDDFVNQKVHQVLNQGMQPLVCVGDTADEKRWSVSSESVVRQVKIALHGVSDADVSKVLIAYEPVWAIGEHGVPASAEEAAVIHTEIKNRLVEQRPGLSRDAITVIYGGSVNHSNAAELLAKDDVDGLFIGRSAWQVEGYLQILDIAHQR